MKWVIAPLVALLVMAGSGYLDALERTTDASVRLARSSREAPRSTEEARKDIGSIPALADLTTKQATALRGLADALDASAERVHSLDQGLRGQIEDLSSLTGDLRSLPRLLDCVRSRIERLLRSSDDVPQDISAIASLVDELTSSQERSVKHLRSINRKLAALGVVATAEGVEVPQAPGGSTSVSPGEPAPGRGC